MPNEATLENSIPRRGPWLSASLAFIPLCESMATRPGVGDAESLKETPPRVEWMPRQLGPIRRMPPASSRLSTSRSRSVRCSSPVSEKPAVKRWMTRTPLATQSSTRLRIAEAGTEEMT